MKTPISSFKTWQILTPVFLFFSLLSYAPHNYIFAFAVIPILY